MNDETKTVDVDIRIGWGDEDWAIGVTLEIEQNEIDAYGEETAITDAAVIWASNHGYTYIIWEYSD